MKKILYLVLVAVLAAAVPAWGQNNQTYTLGKIPAGWTVKANGNTVTVTDSTATIPAGATVVLTPTNPAMVKKVTLKDAPVCRLINLDTLQHDFVAQDCDTLTGTLNGSTQKYKITIADGATVTLKNVTINGWSDNVETASQSTVAWAGLTCEGDATIILKDGSTNSVKGFHKYYPGIYVPVDKTLTIKGETAGTGSLNASSQSNGNGAGIGGGYDGINCGNIDIQGGNITAIGGYYAASIGSGGAPAGSSYGSRCGNISISGGTVIANGASTAGIYAAAGIGCGRYGYCGNISISGGNVTASGGEYSAGIGSGDGHYFYNVHHYHLSECGNILITGGTVTANGGKSSAGIGCGESANCGTITITDGVTQVTAKDGGENAPNSIGAGYGESTCGTVKFGDSTMYNGTSWTTTPTDGGIYGGLSLAITTTTNEDDTWTLTPYVAPIIPTGAINGKFTVNASGDQIYFSQGNLQYQASTGTWRFAEHQYDYIGNDNASMSETYSGWIDLYRWGTSGIDYTGHATLYRPWEKSYDGAEFNPYSSLTTNLYDGDGENAGKADWGYNAISNGGNTQNSGWRTLKNNPTDNEWQYIFNSRTTANEINSTSDARYTQATINTDGTLVKGIILFPDGSIGDTPSGVTWGAINASSAWGTQCTTAGWEALEAAGCVFLPASGKGEMVGTVSMVGSEGHYWSSSSYASSYYAYGMYFFSNYVSPQYSDYRNYGLSVRLVKDAQ